MSRKSCSLGPANMDGVPNEELILAEMIANAEEHELGFATGDTNVTLMDDGPDLYVPTSDHCCAVGAFVAFKSRPADVLADHDPEGYLGFKAMTGCPRWGDVTIGNDEGDGRDIFYGPWLDLGAAYRAYHLEAVD